MKSELLFKEQEVSKPRTALVLGATGGIGGETATALFRWLEHTRAFEKCKTFRGLDRLGLGEGLCSGPGLHRRGGTRRRRDRACGEPAGIQELGQAGSA